MRDLEHANSCLLSKKFRQIGLNHMFTTGSFLKNRRHRVVSKGFIRDYNQVN